jgi:hypothetical protein
MVLHNLLVLRSWRMKMRVESAPSQGDHKVRGRAQGIAPTMVRTSQGRACMVAKERFFPYGLVEA